MSTREHDGTPGAGPQRCADPPAVTLKPRQDSHDIHGAAAGAASTATGSEDASLLLYTPARAAELLAVKESWLRRKAGQRVIPCTFIGKHLRFSGRDLNAIIESGAETTQRSPLRRRR